MPRQGMILIESLSTQSLLIEIVNSGQVVSTATAFLAEDDGVTYIVTNWHVVTGKDRFTGQSILKSGAPDRLRIWLHKKGQLGTWLPFETPLYNPKTGEPSWIDHEKGNIDVVAIPIERHEDGANYVPIDMRKRNPDIDICPAETVSVIGFPYGKGVGTNFPVWKTGHIASDIGLDYMQLPVFLIDATTKPSMSGSPVYFRRYNFGYLDKRTRQLIHAPKITEFLGIYSGRTSDQSDIGMVWKPYVIQEIIARNVRV